MGNRPGWPAIGVALVAGAAAGIAICSSGCTDWRLAPAPDCVVGTTRPCTLVCPGVQRCVRGAWAACEAREPEPDETCNGRDDDCDGMVDEFATDVGPSCRVLAISCGPGMWRCRDGGLVCTGEVAGSPETCNGRDDDCNGSVDDGLNPVAVSDFVPCYTGPAGTLDVGICRPGWRKCIFGKWTCEDEVLPKARDCSSGKDNDCDGKSDEPTGGVRAVDLVLMVDVSGSMSDEINATSAALVAFARRQAGGAARVALVLVPGSVDGQCERAHDLTDPGLLEVAFSLLRADGFGQEPTLDCPYETATGELRDSAGVRGGLSWRPGASRVVVLMSDEPAWSTYRPPLTVDEVVTELRARSIRFYAFTADKTYDVLATATGGAVYPLNVGARQLEADLSALLLTRACGQDG